MEPADYDELRRLVSLCERSAVKALLERHLASGDGPSTAASATSAPAAAVEASAAAPVAAVAPKPVPVPVAAPDAAAASRAPVSYTSVGYGWESSSDGFVEVTVLSGLEGVGALPRENVACDFTKTSFDLRVHGLDGGKRNARLRVPHLDKEIDPAGSKVKIGKNRVTVLLKKVNSYDYWVNLAAKNPGIAKASKEVEADPSAGLMGMMKQLYEDGDDKTKKIIAEAFEKSRKDQLTKAAGGPGKSSFGGAGAGLDDDLDL